MTSVVAFIVVLGVLVFFHEFGHFLLARVCGVGVEKFSLGFGPRLFGFRHGMTDYMVSAVPLGGYVKMVGENPDEEVDDRVAHLSFARQHVLKRFLIVAAGPFFNLLLAVLIFYVLTLGYGLVSLKPMVGKVLDGRPAKEAGIIEGDRIVAVDGIKVETWEKMAALISGSKGKPLVLTIERSGDTLDVVVTPELVESVSIFGEPESSYKIGVVASGETIYRKLGPLSALRASLVQTYEVTRLTVVGVVKIVSGAVSPKAIGGPILIAQMAGAQAKHGLANLLAFIAFISINLAIINMLPIPVLDGGHMLFFAIEAVKGSPVSDKTREMAQQLGLFLIIFLMMLAIYNDIARFFE